MNRQGRITLAAALLSSLSFGAMLAVAETRPSLSFYGVPGLIDMPSGEALPDGALGVTVAGFGSQYRTTLTFQITPRISGSYRFISTRNWNDNIPPGDPLDDGYSTYNDRSFDLRFLVLEESRYLPSLTVGLQDFAGTGVFGAEYVAATKTFGDRFKVTAGLGWGRFGSYNDIGSPFGARPEIDLGMGGKPSPDQWFRGPAAPFAGIEWAVNDRWTVKAEYSSDAYDVESGQRGLFERDSPFNFGIEYQRGDLMRVGLYSLYGSEIGLSFNMVLDPKKRSNHGIVSTAPTAVTTRPSRGANPALYDGGWVNQPEVPNLIYAELARRLAVDGMTIEHLSYTSGSVHLRLRNNQIDAGPQAIGRAARALSQVMPASVEVFEIVPVVRGMGASKVTLRRSDLESLEHAPGNDLVLHDRVTITDAGPVPEGGMGAAGTYPKLTWGLMPGFRLVQPMRGDIGLRFKASYELRPGLILSGTVYKRLADNFDKITPVAPRSPEEIPYHVRSDVEKYVKNGDPAVERLTLAWYAKPADNLYSRVTLGYLERMHAGVSGELLWKPVDSRLALGVEVNYSMQRDTDGGFGFGEYDYGIASGHVSAYYDFGGGYLGQVDVGRYLAGDAGATFSFDREFANGVKIGVYAALTSASAEEFGEGSFDKGIRLTVPMNWVLGQPSRAENTIDLRHLQRDGAVRLDVEGRLYDPIRDYHKGQLDSQWGRSMAMTRRWFGLPVRRLRRRWSSPSWRPVRLAAWAG
ncbi:MAG: YjbH domain-containing protein [Paracoccaceae bacterium]